MLKCGKRVVYTNIAKVQKLSFVDQIYTELKDLIVNLHISLGERLVMSELQARFWSVQPLYAKP